MADYVPSANYPSDSLTLQDIIKAYKSATNEEFIIRVQNIANLVPVQWGVITGSIDNQKDLLALTSLRI